MHHPNGRLNKSQGQIALDNATRSSNGKLSRIPRETAKEILEFFDAGICSEDIAEHFGMTRHQVDWVKHPRSVHMNDRTIADSLKTIKEADPISELNKAELIQKEKLKPIYNKGSKSVAVSEETHKWLGGLSVVFRIKRGEVLDLLAREARKDDKFLLRLIQKNTWK